MSDSTALRLWRIGTNAAMMLGWMRVLLFLLSVFGKPTVRLCNGEFTPLVKLALIISFLEVFNAATGITRSKPQQALLFAVVRFGVEFLVAPVLSTCPSAWSHLLTVFCWSLGDTIRFGCFFLDSLSIDGSRWAKYIRYSVGPILFPLGTLGEMLMVLTWARQTHHAIYSLALYVAALGLWPLGFYSLFTQLLRQRRKFLQSASSGKKKVL